MPRPLSPTILPPRLSSLHKDMTKAEARLADNGSEQTVDRLHKDMTKAEARLADNGRKEAPRCLGKGEWFYRIIRFTWSSGDTIGKWYSPRTRTTTRQRVT